MFFYKRGQTLGKYLINSGPPRNDRRNNVACKIPCATCSLCYVGETSQWVDKWESQHKRSKKNCDSNNGIYMHIAEHPHHTIAEEKTTFFKLWLNLLCKKKRRVKEALYIDIFSKTRTMNLEDGMLKKQLLECHYMYADIQKRHFGLKLTVKT